MATVTVEIRPDESKLSDQEGNRVEIIPLSNGQFKRISVLSFRDRHDSARIVECLVSDRPIAFHGWGVSGVCGRVDRNSHFSKFWELKSGRPPGAKVPLLEPASDAVSHIDWQAVHPDFRHLADPKALRRLWRDHLPFHLIFPYNGDRGNLSRAVVTPANDLDVAPDIPFPTLCLFWMEDPALNHMVSDVKDISDNVQLGVSSLNDSGQNPPFNTPELLNHLRQKQISQYDIVVEDPLLEPLDIASSHSQFRVPSRGEEAVLKMVRQGNLSAEMFSKHTNLPVIRPEGVKVAARRLSNNVDLDPKLLEAAKRIKFWHLKALFHLV